MTRPAKHAVILDGPIGVGKTTLGRELAISLGGKFIDGDDHADPTRPWYCSSLQTHTRIVKLGLSHLATVRIVVISQPLGCKNWIFFRRRFGDAGFTVHFIGLSAAYASIVDPKRGRVFSVSEQVRIQMMISEGYGARPFADAHLDTDRSDFAGTLAALHGIVNGRLCNTD